MAVLLIAFLASGLVFFAKCWMLNSLCRDRSRSDTATLVANYPDWMEELTASGFVFGRAARLDQAAYFYLKGYLIAFDGGERLRASPTYESMADSLVPGRQFAVCMRRLNARASFYEYVFNLPSLAETCQRCVVSQCRRKADQARAGYVAGLSGLGRDQLSNMIPAYRLLAEQTNELAKLFCQHQKLEIADRSYQDAITGAAFAAKFDPERQEHAQDLQRYYLAYVAFLYTQHRDEEALSVLDAMNVTCGNQRL